MAFVAVQKITNAKWSGMIIRFASASAAFLPVSLVALLLIFTAGYPAIYGPMVTAAPELPARQGASGSRTGSCSPGWPSAWALLTVIGWRLIRADLVPDLLAVRGAAPANRRALYDRWTRGYDGSADSEFAVQERHQPPRAGVRGDLRARAHAGGVRRHHGAAAALVLEPARRLLLHGRRSSARTCCWR